MMGDHPFFLLFLRKWSEVLPTDRQIAFGQTVPAGRPLPRLTGERRFTNLVCSSHRLYRGAMKPQGVDIDLRQNAPGGLRSPPRPPIVVVGELGGDHMIGTMPRIPEGVGGFQSRVQILSHEGE